jgi:hypothetical protein
MIYNISYWTWYQYLTNHQVKQATMDTAPNKEDWLVVFQPYSLDRRQLVSAIINRFDYDKRVLIHYEGRYRQPHGFKLRYQQQFGKIYTYVSTDIDCDSIKYMPIPLWIDVNDCKPIGERNQLICTVSTNCAKDREPRRTLIDKLKALGMGVYGGAGKPVPGDIEVKDGNTDVKYRRVYGAKVKLMSNYIFAFAVENQLDLGHLTEKPFDIIAAGCIPVYLGPNDAFKFIPKNCYIDYRDFWSEIDVMNYIKSMPINKIKEYQMNILHYQKQLVGMRTYESCMRFLCKDLGFECDAPYYNDILALSKNVMTGE